MIMSGTDTEHKAKDEGRTKAKDEGRTKAKDEGRTKAKDEESTKAQEDGGRNRSRRGGNKGTQPDTDRDGDRGQARDAEKRKRQPANFDVIEKGVVQLAALTGREPESVAGVNRVDDGWDLTVEVIELERIPPSTNVVATYEAELNDEGNLVGYRRRGRYYRNQPLEE
jgi:hypothetical protein